MSKQEHDCKYAKMIRATPEWIPDVNGNEVCCFCQAPRYVEVTRTPPTRKVK